MQYIYAKRKMRIYILTHFKSVKTDRLEGQQQK